MNRHLRRFIRNKRAITPILSELLLTIIAVAAMSIAASATYVITSNMRSTMGERIVVENVYFNTTTNTVNAYLFNVGKADIEITNVYINQSGPQPGPIGAIDFKLEAGESGWLNITYANLQSGSVIYLDIVTTRGLHIADYYTIP